MEVAFFLYFSKSVFLDVKYSGVYHTVAYTALLQGLEYGKIYQYKISDMEGGTSA